MLFAPVDRAATARLVPDGKQDTPQRTLGGILDIACVNPAGGPELRDGSPDREFHVVNPGVRWNASPVVIELACRSDTRLQCARYTTGFASRCLALTPNIGRTDLGSLDEMPRFGCDAALHVHDRFLI